MLEKNSKFYEILDQKFLDNLNTSFDFSSLKFTLYTNLRMQSRQKKQSGFNALHIQQQILIHVTMHSQIGRVHGIYLFDM